MRDVKLVFAYLFNGVHLFPLGLFIILKILNIDILHVQLIFIRPLCYTQNVL